MIEQATVLIVSDFPEITDNLRRYLLESEFAFRVLLESAYNVMSPAVKHVLNLETFEILAFGKCFALRCVTNDNLIEIIREAKNDIST
jgi:hypothetical protein